MNGRDLARHLHECLGYPLLDLDGGRPCVLHLDEGLVLELRFVAELPALCLAVRLHRLTPFSRAEALVRLMSANLYMADSGLPHYGLAPRDDTLYLCHTRVLADEDFDAAVQAVETVLAGARQAQQLLLREQIVSP